MICPRCSVSEISPLTGKCDLCGFAPAASVVVESVDAVAELARRQIEHEFEFRGLVGRRDGTTVQRVVEKSTGRALILKVVVRRSADRDAEEWFRVSMSALAGFDHPNLTRVLRYGSTDSIFWFATEDHGANSLSERLLEHGPMDLRATRRLLTQVTGALEYLHRRALVHGALKTSNVLVDQDGWVRLADISLTRPAPPPVPVPGSTPVPRHSWVAPEEHLRGERLPAADQYALGALAFECLTGATPGSSNDAAAHLRADVPPRLVLAIERALDEDPTRRYPSCSDFLWALEEDTPPRAPLTPTMQVAIPAPVAPAAPAPPPARSTPIRSPVQKARSTPIGLSTQHGRPTPPASAAVKARASARLSKDVVMIRDWEEAPDPRRNLIRAAQIGVGVLLLAGLVFAFPTIRAIIRPAPTRAPAASTIAPTPVTPPAAIASAATKAPDSGDPLGQTRRPTASAPGTERRTEPRTEPRVAPPRAPSPGSTAPNSTSTPAPRSPADAPSTASTAAPGVTGGAKLFINSSPWGQVSIDGTAVGNTPRANVDLTAGSHVIRVIRAGYVTWERAVRVSAGETLRITDIVLAPTQP